VSPRFSSTRVAGSIPKIGIWIAEHFLLAFVSLLVHRVPFDQPEIALDLFSRWLANTPLVLSKPHKN